MKAFSSLVVLCFFAAGCASDPGAGRLAQGSHFARSAVNAPYVEFIGDAQSIGLLNYAQDPSWQCTICQPSATSTQLLAALPAVLAKKPDAIHILTGAYELNGSLSNPLASRGQVPRENIQTMVTMIQAAKIPVVVGLLPPALSYTPYYLNLGLQDVYFDAPGPLQNTIPPLIDYYDAVYAVDPQPASLTAKDYAVMLPLTQAAINNLHAAEPQ
ncbi:MAG TPA: hypothetical protein VMB49_22995 [Acidobacteriaceae bacterium]|nr:hypothetical protein [Acidobacteriaceae bacterium]